MDFIFQPPGNPVQQALSPTLGRTELRPREGRGPPWVHPWARSEAPGGDCDTLTNLEFSDHGPSPSAPVFSPLPGSRSVLGVTLLSKEQTWTLWGCDPSGFKALCLCVCVRPGCLQPWVLSSLEPALVHAGTGPTLGQELTYISSISLRKLLQPWGLPTVLNTAQ